MDVETIRSVYITLSFDEQFYSTQSKQAEVTKTKKSTTFFKQTYEIKAAHAFNVYSINRTFYVYLHIITKSGLQKCVGVAKIDNLALQVITSRQHSENRKEADDQYSILFFPNNHTYTGANNAIAESSVKCTYSPAMNSFTSDSPLTRSQMGQRSDSCIICTESASSSVYVTIPEESEEDVEKPRNVENELANAVEEYETIGVRSKNFGYVGSQETLVSWERMNENYETALHYMNRYLIADYKVSIPSLTLIVLFPNNQVSPSLAMQLNPATLTNCLYLSLPNPITVSFDSIITPTSRNRLIVNIPTIVTHILKGVDFKENRSTRSDLTRSIDLMHSETIGNTRYLCIGDLVCSARIAMYH